MANETILVVDDAPVSLKLTGILLRKEGYQVHASTDAEQALSLLHSLHPDMMLVDIQLPGMNGLELTRRVKQDTRTRDILVVALTACAMKGDDDRAFQAGCDGYITKPIETITLANKVREYLARRALQPILAPEPANFEPRGFPGGITLTPAELESIRRRFLQDGLEQCRQILENLEQRLDMRATLRLVRGWKEAAAALGYPALQVLAAETEDLLCGPHPDGRLCDAISNLMVGFLEPPETSLGAMPAPVEEALCGKTVALVGLSPEDESRLAPAIERMGARARVVDAGIRPGSDSLGSCHLAVVHAQPSTFGTPWLHPVTIGQWKHPIVLVGLRDHLLDLDARVARRAADLLIDGWQPEEALLRIGRVLSQAAPHKPAAAPATQESAGTTHSAPIPRDLTRETEVLLADDDLTVRMVTRSLVQGAGIKCRMACDGNEAFQAIRDFRPTAAILDVNMPGMDGYEVLAAVRNENLPVRIILLTARQQEADITRGFTLGADDYVVKPFNPPELLARLKRFL